MYRTGNSYRRGYQDGLRDGRLGSCRRFNSMSHLSYSIDYDEDDVGMPLGDVKDLHGNKGFAYESDSSDVVYIFMEGDPEPFTYPSMQAAKTDVIFLNTGF